MATLATASGYPYPATSETPDVQRDLKVLVDYLEAKSTMTTYTPALGVWTVGNGTLVGKWARLGKLMYVYASFTLGSTSAAAAGAPSLTLPANAAVLNQQSLVARFIDVAPGNTYQALVSQAAVGTVSLFIPGASGLITNPSTTTPFTWATGDKIEVAGWLESV